MLILGGKNSQAERHVVLGLSASKAGTFWSLTTVCLDFVKTVPLYFYWYSLLVLVLAMMMMMMILKMRVVLAAGAE